MEKLKQLGAVPVDFYLLRSLFPDYKFPKNKVSSLECEGKLIRLKRGMYVVSPDISGELLSTELVANHLYGPSYISMESALNFYGLIPEKVYTVRSTTTKRSREFKNNIATFQYYAVNENYFSIGINQERVHNKYIFLIASPEKALCDIIISTPMLNFQSIKSVGIFLENDLRFDINALKSFDLKIIEQCINIGIKQKSLEQLQKMLLR